MKYIIFFLLLSLSSFVFAQTLSFTTENTFVVQKNTHPGQLSFYKSSISKSNLESYRLKNKRVVLEFSNGFECELLSAKEVFLKGIGVDMNAYQDDFEQGFTLPIFTVSDNGWLSAEYKTIGKSY